MLGDLARKDIRADDSDGRAYFANGRETVRRIADYTHTNLRLAVEFDLGGRPHVEVIRLIHASEHTKRLLAGAGEDFVRQIFLLRLGDLAVALELLRGAND